MRHHRAVPDHEADALAVGDLDHVGLGERLAAHRPAVRLAHVLGEVEPDLAVRLRGVGAGRVAQVLVGDHPRRLLDRRERRRHRRARRVGVAQRRDGAAGLAERQRDDAVGAGLRRVEHEVGALAHADEDGVRLHRLDRLAVARDERERVAVDGEREHRVGGGVDHPQPHALAAPHLDAVRVAGRAAVDEVERELHVARVELLRGEQVAERRQRPRYRVVAGARDVAARDDERAVAERAHVHRAEPHAEAHVHPDMSPPPPLMSMPGICMPWASSFFSFASGVPAIPSSQSSSTSTASRS